MSILNKYDAFSAGDQRGFNTSSVTEMARRQLQVSLIVLAGAFASFILFDLFHFIGV